MPESKITLNGIEIGEWNETHYDRLTQRRNWLNERIEAKKKVGWDIEYDTAERDALTWVLMIMEQVRPA